MAFDDRDYYKKQLAEKLDRLEGRATKPKNSSKNNDSYVVTGSVTLPPNYKIVRKTPWSVYEILMYLSLGIYLLYKRDKFIENINPPEVYVEVLSLKYFILFFGFVFIIRCSKSYWNNKTAVDDLLNN